MNADQFFEMEPDTKVNGEESVYARLAKVNLNKYKEKKGRFDYVSWAFAVQELLKVVPDATWEVHIFDVEGYQCPYMKTPAGYFVQVTVTANGIPRTQILPVLNSSNKTLMEPDAFQLNTSMMRCLAKAIAQHGLGLYIYAGEDLPPE